MVLLERGLVATMAVRHVSFKTFVFVDHVCVVSANSVSRTIVSGKKLIINTVTHNIKDTRIEYACAYTYVIR